MKLMVVLLLLLLAAFLGFIIYIAWQKKTQTGSTRTTGAMASRFASTTSSVNYLCLECGRSFRGRQCSRCGSKSKRAVFWRGENG